MANVDEVRGYYDANTERFERFGQGGGTIHRAVWGESVRSRDEAFRYIDELILRELDALTHEAVHVLDLGCGVGSSLIFLASRAPLCGTGATLSGVQAERARERARNAKLDERVRFVQANFLELPSSVEPAHLAFSIEAFVHGPDPAAYFGAVARKLHSGGLLVICDDFLTVRGRAAGAPSERRVLEDVRTGWLANTLVTTDEANALAKSAGFEPQRNVDLTPHLELARPRDWLIALVVAIGRHLPGQGYGMRSLVGGHALQRALMTRLLEYRFVVWRKRGELDAPEGTPA